MKPAGPDMYRDMPVILTGWVQCEIGVYFSNDDFKCITNCLPFWKKEKLGPQISRILQMNYKIYFGIQNAVYLITLKD